LVAAIKLSPYAGIYGDYYFNAKNSNLVPPDILRSARSMYVRSSH
jgi:hypothetical protein